MPSYPVEQAKLRQRGSDRLVGDAGCRKARCSLATVAPNNCTSCVTIPTRLRRVRQRHVAEVVRAAACRAERIAPSSGSYSRNSSRVSVVFPLPVRPSTPSTRPGARRKRDMPGEVRLKVERPLFRTLGTRPVPSSLSV